MFRRDAILTLVLATLAGAAAARAAEVDLRTRFLGNEAAYIPPQCYTKTLDGKGIAHNPCYACHVPTSPPNYINDGVLQTAYTFATYAETNRWTNLFEDRTERVAAISDDAIVDYVRTSNYFGDRGQIALAQLLHTPPAAWDVNGDGRWSGFVPDAWFRFDEDGFDLAPDGTATGWRAFAYYPFLGTFWPTNGSTDDVLIRLAEPFRRDSEGQPSRAAYKLNLAIVEAVTRQRDVAIPPTDETAWGVDLDKDGRLATATRVTYDWAPLESRFMSYVGKAKAEQEAGALHLAGGLFPEGTEFLHSVRYIDVDDDGAIGLAARLKELRYMRKTLWRTYANLEDTALGEAKEKDDFPDRLRFITGNAETGVANGQGWMVQGFIEDATGALRPQSFEETVFCVGCHSGVGATTDSIFSFPRRFGREAFRDGWYHWSTKGLEGVPEPKRSDGRYEYTTYLEENGAGDEFRSNREVMARFFDDKGGLKPGEVERLHSDIARLLLPSRERALKLNKAYRTIVEDQDFHLGRDATVTPTVNIHRGVAEEQSTGVTQIVRGP